MKEKLENNIHVTNADKDKAVSDLISAVLLIGVVVAAIGIIGVVVTKDINPTKLPSLSFESCVEGGAVYLYHTGGDVLKPFGSDANFYVNLLDKDDKILNTIIHVPWTEQWAPGQMVNFSSELNPISDPKIAKVQLVARPPSGGDTLVEWAQVGECSMNAGFGPSCVARPHAQFNASPKSGTPPFQVTFTDESSTDDPNHGILYWDWDFGDGTYSTATNPVHTFTSNSPVTVTLNVTNDCSSAHHSMIINPNNCLSTPNASFITTPNPPGSYTNAPALVTFTDTSTTTPGHSIVRCDWDFGDGNSTTSLPLQSVSHTFYRNSWVTLTVIDDCPNSDSAKIYVPIGGDTQDCTISPAIQVVPSSGLTPLTVTISDASTTSRGYIDKWYWEFGDGTTATTQGPFTHVYTNPSMTDVKQYQINLTVGNSCLASGTTQQTITVYPFCNYPNASFIYEIKDLLDFTVQFTDTSESTPFDIVSWYWEFGDGTNATGVQAPLHVYGGEPKDYIVNLTVTNECGYSSTAQRIVRPNCQKLIPGMIVNPMSGPPPLNVSFKDATTPAINVTSWRWLFGDGKSYYTTVRALQNTTHTYEKMGVFAASLIVENECGEAFVGSQVITVSSPANISGHLWLDKNVNGLEDGGETRLSGWEVWLEERVGNTWVQRMTQTTDVSGNYQFAFSAANGIYRVKEILKTNVAWKATYAYHSSADIVDGYVVSGPIPVQATRDYTDVNFGNVDWHTSSFQFPDRFKWGETDGGTTWNDRTTNNGEYWDYTTSYNGIPQRLYNPANKQINPSPSYVFYQVPPYSRWGDSTFTITPGFYMQYLILVQPSGLPPITKTYWLKYWIVNGVRTNGVTFTVPDNTRYTANRTMLYFVRNDTPWSSIYSPFEGEVIPYSTNSYVEVHFTGTSDKNMKGNLSKPAMGGDKPIPRDLTWQPAYGYYTGYWNNTLFENQSVMLESWVDRGPSYPNTVRWYATQRNVWVDWEATFPKITSPINGTVVSGNLTITGTVGGKNRDTGNVNLVINDKAIYPMTWNSGPNTFTSTVNMEQFSGKIAKLNIRAPQLPGRGKTNTSDPVYVIVNSKDKLEANFTADPWSGYAILETALTDLSSGGPNWWNWTFGDGTTSSLQNPIKYYNNTGNYSVTLQVRNQTGLSSSVTKYINVTGMMHNVTLLTDRNGYLASGGSQRFLTMGTSSITVNNTSYPLEANDIVQMDLQSDQYSSRILIAGPYSIFNATNTVLIVNDANLTTGTVNAINITDFVNYHSNMRLVVDPKLKTSNFSLVWDGAPVDVKWNKHLVINNLMPTPTGMDLSIEPSTGEIFFSGMASDYVVT